jgi:hypothetical protein
VRLLAAVVATKDGAVAAVVTDPLLGQGDELETGGLQLQDQGFGFDPVATSIRHVVEMAPMTLGTDIDDCKEAARAHGVVDRRTHRVRVAKMMVDEPQKNGITADGGKAGVFLISEKNGHVPKVPILDPALQLGDQVGLDLGCKDSSTCADGAGENLGPASVTSSDICDDVAGGQVEEVDQKIGFGGRCRSPVRPQESKRDDDRGRRAHPASCLVAPSRHDDRPPQNGLKIARKAARAPISGITTRSGFAIFGLR